MNVSSPTNAADYNEQPPQSSSSSTNKPPSETTASTAGILPSQDVHPSASNRTEAATGFSPFPRIGGGPQKFHPERFASQATAAALSLCADSDSPEEEGPASSHPSKLPSLNRQNRKCKSAVIQVDGRSFTIGEHFGFFHFLISLCALRSTKIEHWNLLNHWVVTWALEILGQKMRALINYDVVSTKADISKIIQEIDSKMSNWRAGLSAGGRIISFICLHFLSGIIFYLLAVLSEHSCSVEQTFSRYIIFKNNFSPQSKIFGTS